MNIFHIKRIREWDYDQFEEAVVICENLEEVPKICREYSKSFFDGWDIGFEKDQTFYIITYIGESTKDIERGVLCASFNAG